ncbi:MAG: polysaccharide deacetylase family protein [Candidatus Aminicenantes bacterium]|nr:MAG: polysaccharide deacetylase family protein [Candidatus Aminicenantes bacterium]
MHFTVVLSHDVDRTYKSYQFMTKALQSLRSGKIKQALYHKFSVFLKNPYWNFDRIIAIEKAHDVKSTFFFLDESIKFRPFQPANWGLSLGRYKIDSPKIAEIIRWLDKNGWEIGLHGSYCSYNSSLLLAKEKKRLENIVGHEIIGIRQHFLNVNEETWQLQSETGFGYDASFGFTRDIGFKDNRYRPFFPLKENENFLVIPMALMDECLMHKKDIQKEYLDIMDATEKNNGVLVLNWHQRIFNEKEYPGYSKVYEEIIEEGKKRKAKFALMGDIYQEYAHRRRIAN